MPSVVNGWVRDVGVRCSGVTEGCLGVDFLVETIACYAESVLAGWLVQLDEDRVTTAVREGHCLEFVSADAVIVDGAVQTSTSCGTM